MKTLTQIPHDTLVKLSTLIPDTADGHFFRAILFHPDTILPNDIDSLISKHFPEIPEKTKEKLFINKGDIVNINKDLLKHWDYKGRDESMLFYGIGAEGYKEYFPDNKGIVLKSNNNNANSYIKSLIHDEEYLIPTQCLTKDV